MKKFILGWVFIGLLLSGGWYTYAGIQQEVGISTWAAGTWRPIRDISNVITFGATGIANGLPSMAPVCHASGSGSYTACGGTDTLVSFAPTEANKSYPITASVINGCVGTTCAGIRGANSASDTANTPVADYGTLQVWSITSELSSDAVNTVRVRNSFTQSTTGVTTNAAGATVTMTGTPMSKYTMIVNRTVGSTNIVEIDLECSIDNTAFVQISTATDLTNEPVLVATGDIPCRYMRYNVVTVGSGNTLAIDLLAIR